MAKAARIYAVCSGEEGQGCFRCVSCVLCVAAYVSVPGNQVPAVVVARSTAMI